MSIPRIDRGPDEPTMSRKSEILRLGDPHMGRAFKNGVPLHRRGEREKSQWRDLHASLNAGTKLHVNMGDIFDHIQVSYGVVLGVAREYKAAAYAQPDTEFVIIRGNHDGSRQAEEIAAYAVLAELLCDVPNIHVLTDEAWEYEGHLFVPWHPFKTAAEMVPSKGSYKSVNGHWDIRDFGDDNPNMIPTKKLMGITKEVFTGHEHKPAAIRNEADDFEIVLTGSMQPYAHGEEVRPERYRTFTLKELDEYSGPVHDLCLRLLLRPGEKPPADLDVAQLTLKQITEEAEDSGEMPQVNVEDFDLRNLYDDACNEKDVAQAMRDNMWVYFAGEKV